MLIICQMFEVPLTVEMLLLNNAIVHFRLFGLCVLIGKYNCIPIMINYHKSLYFIICFIPVNRCF